MKKLKKLTRKGVFETNSSSCHSLTIPKKAYFDLIKEETDGKIIKELEKNKSQPTQVDNEVLKVDFKYFEDFVGIDYYTSLEDKLAFIIQSIIGSRNNFDKKKESYDFNKVRDLFVKEEVIEHFNYLDVKEEYYPFFDGYDNTDHYPVFIRCSFNENGLKLVNYIKSILKEEYNIDRILVSQYFFGEENLSTGTPVFVLKSEEQKYKETGKICEYVDLEDYTVYGIHSPSSYTLQDLSTVKETYTSANFDLFLKDFDTHYPNNEFVIDEGKLKNFLLDDRSFLRITDTTNEVPSLTENKRVEVFDLSDIISRKLDAYDFMDIAERAGYIHEILSYR